MADHQCQTVGVSQTISVIDAYRFLLFEQQLRTLYRARLRQLDRVAEPLLRFAAVVWLFHPFAALHRLGQTAALRLRSVPLDVMDWRPVTAVTVVPLSAPVEATAGELAAAATAAEESAEDVAPEPEATTPELPDTTAPDEPPEASEALISPEFSETFRIRKRPDHTGLDTTTGTAAPRRVGRKAIPGDVYAEQLREHLSVTNGKMPSARQVADLLSIGRDRARRVVAMLGAEQGGADEP
jgi:hypothetical protein